MSHLTYPRCALSSPGHSPHFIQVKRALHRGPHRRLEILEVTPTGVVVAGDGSAATWRLHPRGREHVSAALARGLTHLHDQGTALAVVGGVAISYCADDARWLECASTDVNLGGPVGHFRFDGYGRRVGCADEALDLAASPANTGTWMIV
ncbi:hypothetical protein [Demequina mangrovi]|uniref:Uncharacterized protein n=1 Tax=Demequina mangrovi TaxID=1043493 RepID=A0A1H6Z7V0_9MICO|nr:hypothetical protein [Demequina mangrovi]SEJ45600.1 hypothetical protein SAMN05421637_1837 [Demequina mangrovi]